MKVEVELTAEEWSWLQRFCEEWEANYGRKLTPAQILANFVADFTGSSRSNGSDERDLADQWFKRTHLAMEYHCKGGWR